ncbi:BCCT family transporter [Georgenia sp. TF02-10]|uniref:BCCT family transporter n=1 Tax=Georgenia sp. TF02-10 TaxID=2917725 RepID=UPI001FA76758|nr:BCCT family transporter [Georgenia sp. TF02-10]UNX55250.1 BCCT family transporter [Georgenia sp. TF02-10]
MTSTPPSPAGPSTRPVPPRRRVPAPRVFYPALGIILAAVALAIAFPAGTADVLSTLQRGVVAGFTPYLLVVVAGFVVFAVAMGVSRFGDIKLGQDEDEPEFGLLSWFAMLFAAGMGIGLVFWGAAEPLTFFVDPKPGVDPATRVERAEAAMSQTFLHWGFHAWATYAVIGLALAYAVHRRGRPVSIRWALEPLLGDRVRGRLGDAIDVVAMVGTLFGVATSLGLGVQQISAGLAQLGLVDRVTQPLLIVLIIVVSLIALVSVASGVGRGIKWLSNINLGMAGAFLVALLLLGPTLYLLRDLVQSFGNYLQNIVPLTFHASTYTGAEGLEWQGSWTIFYWGWWISWAPFVGVFIARISRGRTVREFILGVLLVPTAVTLVWFTVLGGTAINRAWADLNGGLFDAAEGVVPEDVLFNLLSGFPASGLLTVIAIVLVAIFFVTSSDSGSLVVTMLGSGGDLDPPRWTRVIWAALQGAVAIALLLAGGLSSLQTAAILTALPVSVVMVGMCVATFRAFRAEHAVLVAAERRQRREELARRIDTRVSRQVSAAVTERLDERIDEQVDSRVRAVLAEPDGPAAPDEPAAPDRPGGPGRGGRTDPIAARVPGRRKRAD